MNKKLLFGIMSLAALTACTNDEFESQKAAENVSPIQFEVVNGQDDAVTRASMNGNKIVWNANDGDLFTLYHGATVADYVNGYQNAIYTAKANEGSTATLTTPSMILEGKAIMVWPADTTFRIGSGDNLTLKIKPYADGVALENIENNIPYVSDLVNIDAYNNKAPYNTAGKDRSYPVFMRPMASQLIVKADYAGTDATLAELEAGEDGIVPIKVTSVDLLTDDAGDDKFTTEIPLQFTAATVDDETRWDAAAPHNDWSHVTKFNVGGIDAATKKAQLTTKVLTGNESCKFLILPQANIAGGVDAAAVVVNTIYGKVVVAAPGVQGSQYIDGQWEDAWYRYISAASKAAGAGVGYDATETPAASAGSDGKFKTTSAIANGMMQTINGFSAYTATSGVAEGEPVGAAATRYVKVLLSHLDMSGLHVTSDKQLRDVVRVWKKMNLGAVTVYLDGDKTNHEFTISQKTIETINAKNGNTLNFKVKPCRKAHVEGVDDEFCDKIVITGADYKQDVQNIAFIAANENAFQADVVLAKETTAWKWNGTVKVTDDGVNHIINKGTLVNATDAILKTTENGGAANNIPLINDGTWNITAGTIRVQFDVTNNHIVNISADAQYRQDGAGHIFTNEASVLPTRFGGNDALNGLVNNEGVFATINGGVINNYSLIEHKAEAAKTYVTTNQKGGDFATAFGDANKMGRINLPWGNKDEDNVSISAALNQGFVSVTVEGEVTGALNAAQLGDKVNYLIIKSGPTAISNVAAQVAYLEVDMGKNNEIAWNVTGAPQVFDGLMILSPVNIKLNTTIQVNKATYLKEDMYVGGLFQYEKTPGAADYYKVDDATYPAPNAFWDGYYGNTHDKVATKYVTY